MAAQSAKHTGRKILIVEDNPTNRRLIEMVLRGIGAHLLTAEDGEQGLEVARREKPDLILMDLQLPGISGVEVTRILKSDQQTSSICIVALTGHDLPEERDAAIQAGCSGYIIKPIDARSFPGKVLGFLNE
jgi:CheY-like chemotaxis protein